MIEKFESAEIFKETLGATRLQNLADYFVQLPSEVAMKLWSVMGDADNTDNVIAHHQLKTSDGRQVSTHLAQILGGDVS